MGLFKSFINLFRASSATSLRGNEVVSKNTVDAISQIETQEKNYNAGIYSEPFIKPDFPIDCLRSRYEWCVIKDVSIENVSSKLNLTFLQNANWKTA